jgi:naringenin degradation protein FdeE
MASPPASALDRLAGDVLIVGGGIAGLAAAIALGSRGVRTTVLERDERATGASIVFQYRPVYALEELGILEEVERNGSSIAAEGAKATPIFNANGDREALPVARLNDGWELPVAVSIYRPVLSAIMRAAARAGGAELLIGHSYRALAQDGDDCLEVELTSGERRRFDLLIGADGINSGIRQRFFSGAGSPTYTGSMSFRAMFHDAPEHWYTGLHLVNGGVARTTMLPERLFYVAVPVHMERRRVDRDEARAIMRDALSAYAGSQLFSEIRERLDEDIDVIVTPFEWIFVPPPWHRGRIVLVGDAVHATAPTIGSAGGMALEDGIVLAQELAGAEGLDAALTAYAERRRERVRLVVETSTELMRGEQQHRPERQWAEMRAGALQKLVEPY